MEQAQPYLDCFGIKYEYDYSGRQYVCVAKN